MSNDIQKQNFVCQRRFFPLSGGADIRRLVGNILFDGFLKIKDIAVRRWSYCNLDGATVI
jgi:hypothetical protein